VKICLNCHSPFEGTHWNCPTCQWTARLCDHYTSFLSDTAIENVSFEAFFFDELMDVEAGHFWFEARNRLIVWTLARHFPEARNILEIGCGTGFVLMGIQQAFPHLTLAGAELYPQGLSVAHQRVKSAEFYQMDARQIPFQDEFDVIGAFDVLEHIEEDEAVLSQMFQATTPGGGILITVPQHRFLWSYEDDYTHHQRRYSRAELVRKVTAAGFKVSMVTSFMSLLMPLMLASRLRHRQNIFEFDPMVEFNINPSVNRILFNVLRAEALVIKNRVSLPMGGSLLLAAHRSPA
jgi:trans-aconitate methyltransferase